MEPPLWQWAIAVQTDPNIFFHCRPVDGATVMAMGHPCQNRSHRYGNGRYGNGPSLLK